MPGVFPEVWENRVRRLIEEDNSATWLDGIPELISQVQVMGEGMEGESNVIHIPFSDFKPVCLINNTAYPLAVQNYTNDSSVISLDKFQTQVVSISDDQAAGASYSIIDDATRSSRESILETRYKKAAHSMAPQQDGSGNFVIEATGEDVVNEWGTTRKRLVWSDLVNARSKRGKKAKKKGWRLVLCDDHVNDLLLDATNKNSEKLADYLSGKITGMLAGFKIYEYEDDCPIYDSSLEKKAYDSPGVTGDREGSFIFHEDNVAHKKGKMKQYFAPAKGAPRTQSNELSYRHYHIAFPVRDMYCGAII